MRLFPQACLRRLTNRFRIITTCLPSQLMFSCSSPSISLAAERVNWSLAAVVIMAPLGFKFLAVFGLFGSSCVVEGSNILFFHTAATASHRTSIWPLAEKLADAGHNVTYVFPISHRVGSHPRIEELTPSKMLDATDNFIGEFDINIRLNNTILQWYQRGFRDVVHFCGAFYESPEIKEWLARPGRHIDLVILDGGMGQCVYGLVHRFRAKHVMYNPVAFPYMWDPFGVVPATSSIPEMLLHQKPGCLQRSLWCRTGNTAAYLLFRYGFRRSLLEVEAVVREKLNVSPEEGMPSFEEIEQETSMVLQNSHFIEDYPMSLPPLIVPISGLHCSDKERSNRKPLPEKLRRFIGDPTKEGFIYVSFGSSVLISEMPESLRNHFLSAFASLPKRQFLWRWTGAVPPNLPSNVLLDSWFPQQELLAHPKIKAFIMQAGRPSTQEALCYAVPMIAIPIFGDQDYNADRLESIDAAVTLDISSLTKDDLIQAIRQVVQTDIYKKRVTELSTMFRDRPVDPLENAFYWVEYVLKYNTTLLKPLGMAQTWWQRRLLDVYALLLAIIIATFALFVLVIRALVKLTRKICTRTPRTSPPAKKRN